MKVVRSTLGFPACTPHRQTRVRGMFFACHQKRLKKPSAVYIHSDDTNDSNDNEASALSDSTEVYAAVGFELGVLPHFLYGGKQQHRLLLTSRVFLTRSSKAALSGR